MHLVTLARWRPPIAAICTQTDSHVTTEGNKGNKGSWAFTVNCSGISLGLNSDCNCTAFVIFALLGTFYGSHDVTTIQAIIKDGLI